MPKTNPIRIRYDPRFDTNADEWILRVPKDCVQEKEAYYEVRLPLYLAKTYLSPYALSGPNIGVGCGHVSRANTQNVGWVLKNPRGNGR